MEIAMAAEDDGNLAEDSADSSDDMRAGDVGEGVVAELAPRGTNGAKINGARWGRASLAACIDRPLGVAGSRRKRLAIGGGESLSDVGAVRA